LQIVLSNWRIETRNNSAFGLIFVCGYYYYSTNSLVKEDHLSKKKKIVMKIENYL